MITILTVCGTRPEAIKLAPLLKEFQTRQTIRSLLLTTGQHKELLDRVLDDFGLLPDFRMALMKDRQTLSDITVEVLNMTEKVLSAITPDLVLVHGDTTSAFAASLAAFYRKLPVGHVEAGLRTGDLFSPFPEEFNRRTVALTASLHFAPTEISRENLLSEGVSPDRIFVTGNTVTDALRLTHRPDFRHPLLDFSKEERLILLTAHRRESRESALFPAFCGIRRAVRETPDVKVIFPMHPHPAVREAAHAAFDKEPRILLTEPLGVIEFHNLLARAHLAVSDSGGIQEEAAALKIPLLVLRDKTERVEGLSAGTLRLIGTDERTVYRELASLLHDPVIHRNMTVANASFGDGNAAVRISDLIETQFSGRFAYSANTIKESSEL